MAAAVVLALAATAAACSGASTSGPTGSTAPQPAVYRQAATFSTPPDAGTVVEPLAPGPADLSQYGYVEHEYFASGTASAFKATATPTDGRWSITPTTKAAYRTRILVRRPQNAAHFNGTVIVEWMNVSAGESAPDWMYLNPELSRAGYAYVGVSAQALAVDGGSPIINTAQPSKGLVGEDPARYGTLHHPGDQYAYDIYAQIARALRVGGGVDVLGPLHPKHLVAMGESQSAAYLTTFADTLLPHVGTFDGVFIHSRGGSGAPLNGSSAAGAFTTKKLLIRTDLSVPVFMFETQTDLIELGYAAAQQPNTRLIRTWEVAGTSHADKYLVGSAAGLLGCTGEINDGPQHVVAQAALAAFGRWVTKKIPPPSPSPFKLASTNPAQLALDAHGNVQGGVRTPAVDVPVATLSAEAPPGATVMCSLFGSTTDFSADTLVSLYHDKQTYLARYSADLNRAVKAGYLLGADRAALMAKAEAVTFPS